MNNLLDIKNSLFSYETTIQINNAFDKVLQKVSDFSCPDIDYKHTTGSVHISAIADVTLTFESHVIDDAVIDISLKIVPNETISTTSLYQIARIDSGKSIDMYCCIVGSGLERIPSVIQSDIISIGGYVTMEKGKEYYLHIEYII